MDISTEKYKFSIKDNDNFWKKAQIFCQIILGNEDDAIFDAELLRASGSQDNNFFNLLYSLIGQKEDFIIEEDKLELLHIIMMDQIRNIIPSEVRQSKVVLNTEMVGLNKPHE